MNGKRSLHQSTWQILVLFSKTDQFLVNPYQYASAYGTSSFPAVLLDSCIPQNCIHTGVLLRITEEKFETKLPAKEKVSLTSMGN
jgi:hypothetical protein